MTKLVKNLSSITALLGVVLSGSVLAANSFQEVAEANSASIRAHEIVEAPAKRAPALTANSFQEVLEETRASIWGQEIVEAPAKRAPVLTANSFQEVIEETRASIWGQEMIGANEAIAVDDRKVDTNL